MNRTTRRPKQKAWGSFDREKGRMSALKALGSLRRIRGQMAADISISESSVNQLAYELDSLAETISQVLPESPSQVMAMDLFDDGHERTEKTDSPHTAFDDAPRPDVARTNNNNRRTKK